AVADRTGEKRAAEGGVEDERASALRASERVDRAAALLAVRLPKSASHHPMLHVDGSAPRGGHLDEVAEARRAVVAHRALVADAHALTVGRDGDAWDRWAGRDQPAVCRVATDPEHGLDARV